MLYNFKIHTQNKFKQFWVHGVNWKKKNSCVPTLTSICVRVLFAAPVRTIGIGINYYCFALSLSQTWWWANCLINFDLKLNLLTWNNNTKFTLVRERCLCKVMSIRDQIRKCDGYSRCILYILHHTCFAGQNAIHLSSLLQNWMLEQAITLCHHSPPSFVLGEMHCRAKSCFLANSGNTAYLIKMMACCSPISSLQSY